MMRRYAGLVALLMLALGGQAQSAEMASKGGIIKGTITLSGQPTPDAVVSIQGVPQEIVKARLAALKSKKAVMNQREMQFTPRVLPVVVGTTVEFPNNDTSWHNVFSKSEAKDFDLGLYPPGTTRTETFDKPGVVRILCNVHPAMEGFVVAEEHPFFSGADRRGNYRIDNVPLGKVRVKVWHPRAGTTDAEVTLVREGQVLDVNFDLKK
ncbi:MAG: carboxypeptidase regulatory-like domain-containing protein [Deltaproteobacteria bacterium]|nr:carboxypeptidase regulatory-like domain-containing protein [Deltaproteobacteria bacterium]